MRIITCKLGHSIAIGEEIDVTLVQVQLSQDQVRLGINAPRAVGIYRRELLQAIRAENRRAATAQTSPDALTSAFLPPAQDAE
ncbi:MAG TPA: carbon storage regulator [Armatimonadota bacterium]|nr:carbon storage regulator [Armatimonadota bacterium]